MTAPSTRSNNLTPDLVTVSNPVTAEEFVMFTTAVLDCPRAPRAPLRVNDSAFTTCKPFVRVGRILALKRYGALFSRFFFLASTQNCTLPTWYGFVFATIPNLEKLGSNTS